MRLTYWAAKRLDDSECYNVRARLKREAKRMVEEMPGSYGPVTKITVEYKDAFDLLNTVLTEGGHPEWELPDNNDNDETKD